MRRTSCLILRFRVSSVSALGVSVSAGGVDSRLGAAQTRVMTTVRGLLTRVETWAADEGRSVTAEPGLWAYRSAERQGPKPVEARMVTLAVVLRGRKRVRFGELELTYGPGSYLFVAGERKYLSYVEEASPRAPYLSLGVELPPEEIADVLLALSDAGEAPLSDAEAAVMKLEPPVLGALARMLDALADPVSQELLLPLARRELLVHLLRGEAGAILRRATADDDGRIRRARAFLEAHAGERVTVAEVARHVAMSPSHFAHRFRAVMRMSPMRYVKHIRLQQARRRMLSEGLGAAEAGASVGYASPSQFNRDFKSYFGASPRAYVERFRAT